MSWISQVLFDSAPSTTGAVSFYTGQADGSIRSNSLPQEEATNNHSEDEEGYSLEGLVIDIIDYQYVQGRAQRAHAIPDEEESSYGGQTILSSAPSAPTLGGEALPPSATTISPMVTSPTAVYPPTRNPLSFSTVSSMEMDIRDVQGTNDHSSNSAGITSSPSFASSLSFQPSLLDSALSFSTDTSNLRQQSFRTMTSSSDSDTEEQSWSLNSTYSENEPMDIHISTATNRSATGEDNSAAQQAVVISTRNSRAVAFPQQRRNNGNVVWYANFCDEDWQALRRSAKMVLKALGYASLSSSTTARNCLRQQIPLPPLPPEDLPLVSVYPPISSQDATTIPINALQVLPSCFICPLCQDTIVGALTLDCDCRTNVCTACWEYHCVTTSRPSRNKDVSSPTFDLARDFGYTIVTFQDEQDRQRRPVPQPRRCPCCFQDVSNPLDCHALDVAILNVVQNLLEQQPGRAQHQQSYYVRLKAWRDEVVRRQQEAQAIRHQDQEDEEDLLLNKYVAQLIQDEEEVLWRKQCSAIHRRHYFPDLSAISFLLAAAASIGFKMLSQNHQIRS